MVITIQSVINNGLESHIIPVEIDIEPHEKLQFNVIGLSETMSNQIRRRIQVALKNNGVELPEKKIMVNLGTISLDKADSTILDLPIVMGILVALDYIKISKDALAKSVFVGEVALDGSVRPVKGILSATIAAQAQGIEHFYIPLVNVPEARLIPHINIYGIRNISQLLHTFGMLVPSNSNVFKPQETQYTVDFGEVKGQLLAKRALQIAAAGRHHIIFMGPPGAGKSMLAQRLPTIMPAMTYQETIESTRIYSATQAQNSLMLKRPYRSPHHSISLPALVGGGINPAPGEISLAHNGILFLDELTEFKPSSLESLRQPLETYSVTIVRKASTVTFPCFFLLVAAFNPCPCGYLGDSKKQCKCSRNSVYRYLAKLSGPIMDRIDIQISLQSVEYEQIHNNSEQLNSATMKQKVDKAIAIQQKRYNGNFWNGTIPVNKIPEYCVMSDAAQAVIKKAFDVLKLSMRGYHKILKISRTIADIEGHEIIQDIHIKEALTYRSLDQTMERLKS